MTESKHKTKWLIACGAVVEERNNHFLMGDCLGFIRSLKALGEDVRGYSSFRVDEYFQQSGNKVKTIKFGFRYDNAGNQPIEVYKQGDEKEWQELDKGINLPKGICHWIKRRSEELASGDFCNLILIGHGNATGGIHMNGKCLSPEALTEALGQLNPEVHVNVMMMSCHAGQFVESISTPNVRSRYLHVASKTNTLAWASWFRQPSGRFRNSLFGESMVKQFRRLLESKTSIGNMIEEVNRSSTFTPAHVPKTEAMHYLDPSLSLHMEALKVITTRYADMTSAVQPQTAHNLTTATHNPTVAPGLETASHPFMRGGAGSHEEFEESEEHNSLEQALEEEIEKETGRVDPIRSLDIGLISSFRNLHMRADRKAELKILKKIA
ncbi:hypothetical protein LTS18_012796, partial [Coniosporium uncinatum]